VIEVDIIAKRYGKLPSEIKNLDIKDFEFNLFVASQGLQEEAKQSKEAQRRRSG
jgi:hypothetical protein